MNRTADWIAVAALTAGGGWLADRAGVPSGYLFAALVGGLGWALRAPGRLALPEPPFRAAQAITGVALGTLLHTSTVSGLGSRWLPVLLVSVATLAATIVAGMLLARVTSLDRPTASLGMIAGGASGIVGIAGDLGGDDRLVAFMQYLRVLLITLLTPLLVPLLFGVHGHGSGAGPGDGAVLGTAGGWLLTLGAGAAGAMIGRRLRLPAGALLGPLALTGALSITGAVGGAQVPPLLREAAFALIGLRIGLGFDRATLRRIARAAPAVAGTIAGLLVVCFGFGWLLRETARVSLLDGYLATTPGGLYAVLPIAFGAGGNTTFVLAVQVVRLMLMLVAAPAVVRRMLPVHPERRR